MDTLINLCRLPLIACHDGLKNFYRLDIHGKLQHWQFNKGSWNTAADNLFLQSLEGFDGAHDNDGVLHLLGYTHEGKIYHFIPSLAENGIQVIKTAPSHIISQLSCCFDSLNQLQILYLSDETNTKLRQQLYHLKRKDEQWQSSLVDFVDNMAYCGILADRRVLLYLIYPLQDENSSRAVLRCMNITDNRPGRIYLLPGGKGLAGPPSSYCDAQNNIHLAWINSTAGKTLLNYIRRGKTGDWQHFLQTEVPSPTLPVASLSFSAKEIFIFFQWSNKLGLLYSHDSGKHWQRGKDRELERESILTRLRFDCAAWKKTGENQLFFLNFKSPPDNMLQNSSHSNKHYSGALNNMAIISATVFKEICRLETENTRNQDKLQQKEKELASLKEQEQSKIAELEKKLTEKAMQTGDAERLCKETLQNYQKKQEREKEVLQEQLILLRKDVIKLQHQKEQLFRQNSELNLKLAAYEENKQAIPQFKQVKGKQHIFNQFLKKILTTGNYKK